jgi:ElaB/YqjD/DUF883 family membrane-anchored ribosome-binding protein
MQQTQNMGSNGPASAGDPSLTEGSEATLKSAAAGGLDSAASVLDRTAEKLPGGEAVKNAAHNAADALSSTAEYVRGHDLRAMRADVGKFVKDHPGAALLTAAALGFLVARSWSRG